MREAFERALSRVGVHPILGGAVWTALLRFEKEELEDAQETGADAAEVSKAQDRWGSPRRRVAFFVFAFVPFREDSRRRFVTLRYGLYLVGMQALFLFLKTPVLFTGPGVQMLVRTGFNPTMLATCSWLPVSPHPGMAVSCPPFAFYPPPPLRPLFRPSKIRQRQSE